MSIFQQWILELGDDSAAIDDLRRIALRVVAARAAKDLEFAGLLRTDQRRACRDLGVGDLLANAPPIVTVPSDALVLRAPARRRPDDGPIDPPPDDPPTQLHTPFRGSASHGASNPFSGGHKGYDIWVITLPVGVEYGQVGFADDTGQISLEHVDVLVTASSQSRQTTLRLHFRWWYNMWTKAHYEFAIFSGNQSSTVSFDFDQDDSAPAADISWSTGKIYRFIDNRDLDGWTQITPA